MQTLSKKITTNYKGGGIKVLTDRRLAIVADPEKIFFGKMPGKESVMGKWLIAAILSVAVLAMMFGCEEKQMQQVDQLAGTVEQITQGGQVVLDSPVGTFVPPGIRLALEMGGALAMGLVVAWRDWRKKQIQTALEQVVSGIEIAKENSESTSKVIKDAQSIVQSSKTTELVAKARAA